MDRLTIRLEDQCGNPTDSIVLRPYMRYQEGRSKYLILNRLADYEDLEEHGLLMLFPQTIGNITYYSAKDLIDWVKNQQQSFR